MCFLYTFRLLLVAVLVGGKTIPLKRDDGMELALRNLIHEIKFDIEVQTIALVYQKPWNDCGIEKWHFHDLAIPMVVSNVESLWYLKPSMNSNVLSIICISKLDANYIMTLTFLFRSFRHMRSAKFIFVINCSTPDKDLAYIQEFFVYCWMHKALNVVVIFKDFHKTLLFYAYNPFPQVEVEIKRLTALGTTSTQMFPERLQNLQGHVVLTLPDQVEPRCVLSYDPSGKPILSGYVGHFIQLFAYYLNASLQFPFPIKRGEIMFYGDLEYMARNNTIDLAGSLVPAINAEYGHMYSYPFELTRICMMIPVAENKPIRVLFFYLMNYQMCLISLTYMFVFTALLNVEKFHTFKRKERRTGGTVFRFTDAILNDVALRGILGQSFVMQPNPGFKMKLTYILISLTGLYLNLIYEAYLQTLLTHPLKEKQPKTFGDLRAKPIYTLMSENEILYFDKKRHTDTSPLYRTVSYEEFRRLRNNFNTSYAYPANNMVWETFYRNQQKFFSTNLFIFSEDACFQGSHLLSFALSENSIYQSKLNHLILLVRAHGLIDHWFRTSFTDMVAAGRASFRDLSEKPAYGGPLKLVDMNLILTLYALIMTTSIGIFLAEVGCHHLNRVS